MTERVLRAMKHPRAAILAHPTGRLIGAREWFALDLDKVLRAARDLGVLLEIDSQPERLDLHDVAIRAARDAGVKLALDSDAHRVGELDCVQYGLDQARRGWCEAKDVANTLPLRRLLALLRGAPSADRVGPRGRAARAGLAHRSPSH